MTELAQLVAARVPVMDVSAKLGHSSKAMTLDVYVHALPDAGRGVAAQMEALLA